MILQTIVPLYCSFKIRLERTKLIPTNPDPNPDRSNIRRNTSKYNEDAISLSVGIIMIIVATIYLILDLEANFVEDYQNDIQRFLLYLIADLFYSLFLVVLSCYFYATSSELRAFFRASILFKFRKI